MADLGAERARRVETDADEPGETTCGERGDDVERTVAFWHSGMSRATYVRLLRLLFDPAPDHGDGGSLGPGGRAA